jgi:transcriptional regulator with PAS, ATPase and Fis domain
MPISSSHDIKTHAAFTGKHNPPHTVICGDDMDGNATLLDLPMPSTGASMQDTVEEVLIPTVAPSSPRPMLAAEPLEPMDHSEVIPIVEPGECDPISEALGHNLRDLREQIQRVAPQDTAILLTGETGTGKTRLARYIHEHSRRRDKPFLIVDCGALSPGLIESEMFGHVRGAFTGADRDRPGKFAAVGHGTLLLDEVNSLPLPLQGKLLRAVDERVFEPVGGNKPMPLQARVIAVSNVPLQQKVAEGKFRSDLYYRLNVVEFFLPPVRERRHAILPLANRFLAEFVRRNRPDIHGVTTEALRHLTDYDWPGNVRELRNVLERMVALSAGPVLCRDDLPECIKTASFRSPPLKVLAADTAEGPPLSLSQAKEGAEVWRIKQALAKHKNNRLRAAAELGISRMGLYKKLHKYSLK